MEANIRVTEMELDKLKRVVNVNHLEIKFTGYTRLQPNTPLGSSEAEVSLTYNNAEEVYKLGFFFAKEGDNLQFGKVNISFP